MNFPRRLAGLTFLVVCLAFSNVSLAHFIWLAPAQNAAEPTVEIFFGESPAPDDPDLLHLVEGIQLWSVSAKGNHRKLEPTREGDSLIATGATAGSLVVGKHDYGVMNRGDKSFHLSYYAMTQLPSESSVSPKAAGKLIRLNLVPTVKDDQIQVTVLFDDQPAENASVTWHDPAGKKSEATTNANGQVTLKASEAGQYAFRARVIEAKSGEVDGAKFDEKRHYCTLTFPVNAAPSTVVNAKLQPLAEPVTSFGGAILNGDLYIYGGHIGSAHSYSYEEQDHHLRKLDLSTGQWSVLAEGPHLQGLALVPHGDKLYRLGGFTAKNKEGEEHDLWSQDSAAAFNTQTGEWESIPNLPEPRSSFDAAVLDDTIYVIGGGNMAGEDDSHWHDTAWKLDLSAEELTWEELPTPPFKRRAIAVAAHAGKVYTVGGMQEEGGPTTRVDVFDPQTNSWSRGPNLKVAQQEGEEANERSSAMTGFGASAFATGGHLYVSTIKGTLQRLSDDGSEWNIIENLPTARFFHRMLPVDNSRLLVVGGANMSIGKFDEIEIIEVP